MRLHSKRAFVSQGSVGWSNPASPRRLLPAAGTRVVACLLALGAITWAAPLLAAVAEPSRLKTIDSRIRDVEFDSDHVVAITGFPGYQTLVIFSADEQIEKVTAGYSEAWDVVLLGHMLALKPRLSGGDTNLTVVTTRRVYAFDLSVADLPTMGGHSTDPAQIYVLRFQYPSEDEARNRRAHVAAETERLLRLPDAGSGPLNTAYTYMGQKSLVPHSASDDGRFTYLTFVPGQHLPAIFIVNSDGSESLVNQHIELDTVIVEDVVPQLVLRLGEGVACLYNENPDGPGVPTGTGTISPRVERVLKGAP